MLDYIWEGYVRDPERKVGIEKEAPESDFLSLTLFPFTGIKGIGRRSCYIPKPMGQESMGWKSLVSHYPHWACSQTIPENSLLSSTQTASLLWCLKTCCLFKESSRGHLNPVTHSHLFSPTVKENFSSVRHGIAGWC